MPRAFRCHSRARVGRVPNVGGCGMVRATRMEASDDGAIRAQSQAMVVGSEDAMVGSQDALPAVALKKDASPASSVRLQGSAS